MPSRWVVNPVIFHDGARKPKVATIPDPGRPPEIIDGDTVIRYYRHSSSIGEMERCLSYVVGADLSALDADPEITTVLDGNDENLALTPYDKKWKADRFEKMEVLLWTHGADHRGIGPDTPLWVIVQRLGKQFHEHFTPKGTWVSEVGKP